MPESEATVSPEELIAHRTWVRGLARRLLGNSAAADDAEQETMLCALRSPPPRGGRVRAWLGTVLRHSAYRAHRGEVRRRRREGRVARPVATDASPTEILARAESHRLVVNAVLALDEPYRTAVLLRFYQDLPVREVAARTGVPTETARTRLKRARARLREALSRGRTGLLGALAPLVDLSDGPTVAAGTTGVTGGRVHMTATTKILVALGAVALAILAIVLVAANVPAPEPVRDTVGLPEAAPSSIARPRVVEVVAVGASETEYHTAVGEPAPATGALESPEDAAGSTPPAEEAPPSRPKRPRGSLEDRISFDFAGCALSHVLDFISKVRNIVIVIDPAATRRGLDRIEVTLKLENVEVHEALDILAERCGFAWLPDSAGRIRIR